MVSFLSSKETILRLGIEPPTTPFNLGISPLSSSSLGSSRTNKSSVKIVYIHPHTQMTKLTCKFEHTLLALTLKGL